MLRLQITADSRVGCVRQNNEDMLLVGDTFVRNAHIESQFPTATDNRLLLALADGMGGHSSGEVASSDVLHNLQFFFGDLPQGLRPGDFNEMIYEWLESINNIIDAKGRSDARYHEMGTTLVALAYYEGNFFWMNCGDSRLYRLRNGKLLQMSTDHSLSNLLGSSQHSNVITNCIGGGCKTSYIDIVCCTERVLPGDKFLLCSDGLSDMVADERLQHMLADGATASELCCAAEEAGGFDNVSAIVVTIHKA